MCLACGVTQVPVCSAIGACGGVSLFAQIVTLSALSLSLFIGTANLWVAALSTNIKKFLKRYKSKIKI